MFESVPHGFFTANDIINSIPVSVLNDLITETLNSYKSQQPVRVASYLAVSIYIYILIPVIY